MNMQTVRPTGGDLLAGALKAAGVEKVFALHGGHLEAFYKGCKDHGVDLVDFRHEASAGHAADAYARATKKLGVCVITAGPGFTNAITAIVNAQLDSVPTLFIVSSPPLREAETNPLQGGFDQVAMATPGCKWAYRVTNTERMPDIIALAARKAMTGRRGAVMIDVPIDVLHMTAHSADVTAPTGARLLPRPAPSASETSAIVEMLKSAKRPAIVCGVEAAFSDAQPQLVAFAEASGIPVFTSKRAHGMIPAGHRLEGHDPSNLGALVDAGAPGADAFLILGARLGLYMGGRGTRILPSDAKIAHVHMDVSEIGRIREPAIAVNADVRSTLEALVAASADVIWPDFSEWADRVTALKGRFAQSYPETDASGGISPFHAAAEVARVMGPKALYAIDGGETGHWAAIHARVDTPGHVMATGYLGCLGVSQGFAIGAQIARPDRRVALLAGDGGFGFNIQELDTMVRHQLPIINVVFNNGIWGMSIHGQQIMYGQNYNAITTLGGTEYAAIAQAFGCHGEKVERFADLAPALERALASKKPAVIEVMVDPNVVHPVTVAALGTLPDDGSEVMIPYYENVPVRR